MLAVAGTITVCQSSAAESIPRTFDAKHTQGKGQTCQNVCMERNVSSVRPANVYCLLMAQGEHAHM